MNEEQTAHTLTKEEKRYRKVVRKRVVVEEEVPDKPDPHLYEPVKFIFYNEEQRGVPGHYNWTDKWIRVNECQGNLYDGQTYSLPRVVFEYLRDQCVVPVRSNVEEEVVPGQMHRVSKIVGYKPRYRLVELAA